MADLLHALKQLKCIVGGLVGHLLIGHGVQFGEYMAGVSDERGLVGASGAFRLGAQVRGVCFDEQAIDWQLAGDIAKRVVLLVGEHSGEADIESHVDVFEGVFKGCAEGVHHTLDGAVFEFLLKNGEHFMVAVSGVDDYR